MSGSLAINYSLSLKETLLFPVAPAYGFRHLRKEGYLNKIIGVIELIPVLGPLVSVIERVVYEIFKNRGSAAPQDNIAGPLPSERLASPPESPPIQAWINSFKANVQTHFKSFTDSVKEVVPPISLTPQEQLLLIEAVKKLNEYDIDTVHLLKRNNGVWTFTVPGIPKRIFRLKEFRCNSTANFDKRLDATQKAREVIASDNLFLLHTPQQEILKLDLGDGQSAEVFMEQEFDILHGYEKQAPLFQYCLSDADLNPFIRECARQLIILIIKAGYTDVRYDNNPLLTNGRGMALIDLDTDRGLWTGLIDGRTSVNPCGILSCLSLQMVESLEPVLRENLSEEKFKSLNLDAVKAAISKKAEHHREFSAYLAKKKIVTGKEQVNFGQAHQALQDRINALALPNLGFHLPTERQFVDCDDLTYDHTLAQLKTEEKIFDWVNLRTLNPNARGHYIWC